MAIKLTSPGEVSKKKRNTEVTTPTTTEKIKLKEEPVTTNPFGGEVTVEKSPMQVLQDRNTAANTPTKYDVPTTFKDPKTGIASGVTLPDGRTFLGLKPSDIQAIVAGEAAKNAQIPGAQTIEQAAQLRERQAMVNQVGQFTQLPVTSPQGIDIEQANRVGLGATLPAAVGAGATAGLAIGGAAGLGIATPVTAPVGAAIGAVAGALTSFLVARRNNVKQQINENVQVDVNTLTKGITNLKALATDTNKNPQNAAENIDLFNQQLAIIDQAYSQLKLDTQQDAARFKGIDGSVELMKYEMFNSAGGQRDFLTGKMQTALLKPNPNEDLISVEEYLSGVEE